MAQQYFCQWCDTGLQRPARFQYMGRGIGNGDPTKVKVVFRIFQCPRCLGIKHIEDPEFTKLYFGPKGEQPNA